MKKEKLTHPKRIQITVNGDHKEVEVEPNDLLINVIRNDLKLTGTKYGCGTGECGACTILLDGEPVFSCLTLAIEVDGKEITTIEGIADEKLHPIQKAFIEEGAVQCGFCTSGMIIMTKALLENNPEPTEEEIRSYLKGNLCRCTGYNNIINAVKKASKNL